MRAKRPVGLGVLVLLACGCNSGFSVGIDVTEECPLGASKLTISAMVHPSEAVQMQNVDKAADFFAGSHRIVIVPPAGSTGIDLTVTALDDKNVVVGSAMTNITVSGHQLFETTLMITGACLPDGGIVLPDGPGCTFESCSGKTPYCDTKTGFCAGCLTDDHCPDGQVCEGGKCTPGCDRTHGCGDGGLCDVDAGRCQVCKTDSDCGGATPRCDTTDGRCQPCLLVNDNCPQGQKCTSPKPGTYVCSKGCKGDADCVSEGAGNHCCTDVCVDTTLDDNNCGTCGNACAQGLSCCGSTCANIAIDSANCGGCGIACTLLHAVSSCANAKCKINSCVQGWADCDQTASTGCEQDISDDITNCGGCGVKCPGTNVMNSGCGGGNCLGTCVAGFADCDQQLAGDGCEVSTGTDPNNCGMCGTVCSNMHMMTRTCGGGMCNGTCEVGYGDCDMDKKSDGCEVDTNGSVNNCGGCGKVCSNLNVAKLSCSTGTCTDECNGGFKDCNNDPLKDGCESNVATDPMNCGDCGRACSNQNVMTLMCSNGVCTSTCANGFADCDGDLRTDGCEAQLGTVMHCGGCTPCPMVQNGSPKCVNNQCQLTCQQDWMDCDQSIQTGCETNVKNNSASCGKCGNVCGPNTTCVNNLCVSGKRVFVSSMTFTGNMGGIGQADIACGAMASNAFLGGTWRAWLSDRNNSLASRFNKSLVPYILVDGTEIAPTFAALSLGLMHQISLDEHGNLPPLSIPCSGTAVYTDTDAKGMTFDPNNDCGMWMDDNAKGALGDHSLVDGSWAVHCTNTACNGPAPIYCFEQ
jgi:hypothetical protein